MTTTTGTTNDSSCGLPTTVDLDERFSSFQLHAVKAAREDGWRLIDRRAIPLRGGRPMPVMAYSHDDGRIDVMMIAGNGQRVNHEMHRPGDPDYDEISAELPENSDG